MVIKCELYIACTGVSISIDGFISYFTHRSCQATFSRKKEASSLKNIVNKNCVKKPEWNVLMMCFHKGPPVLHYVLVNAILQSIFTVLHRICLCAKVHNLVFIICPLLLGIYCVTYKSKVVESYIFLKKLFSSVWSPECWTWHFRASKFQNSLGKNAPSHPPPSKKGD